MAAMHFVLPAAEFAIIWRYLDGVSHALAARLRRGSSPGEENLTFLLCELLDEGTTSFHSLEYPLEKAKADLLEADGGITLDVAFTTHEHSKHVEGKYSGADLGIVFEVEHPRYEKSTRAVLLQAKRLFPSQSQFALTSTFSSYKKDQCDFLSKIANGFSVDQSVFYLWYCPSTDAFANEDQKIIRSLEATSDFAWAGMFRRNRILDSLMEFGWPWHVISGEHLPVGATPEDRRRVWRRRQPAIRVSDLSTFRSRARSNHPPSLVELYGLREQVWNGHRPWPALAFEPFAELFFLGLLHEGVGSSAPEWVRLARGEKVPLPQGIGGVAALANADDGADGVPVPRHTITFTLRNTMRLPADEAKHQDGE